MKQWTTEQIKAIKTIDRDIIVSASAGAGKTSTMVERALSLIVDQRLPVEKLMLLTFSNNSAGEMKERLRLGMIDYAKQHPEDADYIREQLDDLSQSDISTIHGFCFKLVREFFEVVGLSPSVGISPDDESVMNRAKAMENTLKRCENDPEIGKLMSKLSLREDKSFTSAISRFYDYMTAQPDRNGWLDKCVESYSEKSDFEHSQCSRFVAKYFSSTATIYARRMREYIALASDFGYEKTKKYGIESLALIEEFETVTNIRELFDAYADYKKIKNPRAVKPKDEDGILFDKLDALKKEFKAETIKQIDTLFPTDCSYEEIVHHHIEAGKQVEQLVKAVRIFQEEYDKIKSEQNVIDFNDMERYAVEILRDPVIASEVRDRHEYVFVDEFQDTNYVEFFIISTLTKPERLFVVGDVKQSIYRFRLAEPKIFLDTLSEWEKQDKSIFFKDNFRSDGRILDFVNRVFDLLMIPEFGEIDYIKDGRFNESAKRLSEDIPAVQIIKPIKSFEKKEKAVVPKDEQGYYDIIADEIYIQPEDNTEAGLIYNYIQSVLGKKIIVKGVERTVDYKDICLMYNTRSSAQKTLTALTDAGLPLNVSDFEANVGQRELDVFMDYLSVIDNLYDDYPLIASLHSFIGGLSNKDLAKIRISAPKTPNFYTACNNYIKTRNDALSERLKEFFDQIEKFRFMATFTEITEFMKIVLEQSGYDTYLLSLENGEKIFSQFNVFIDGLKGKKCSFDLYTLLNYYKKVDYSKIKTPSDNVDGIRVCTTHSSKGLEFPIVILAGLSSSGNNSGGNILTDRELGVGMMYYDEFSASKLSTVDMQAIKIKRIKDECEDKLRLFYVALTRAECSLAVVMSESEKGCVFPFVKNNVSNWLNYCIENDPFIQAKVVYQEPYKFEKTEKKEREMPIETTSNEIVRNNVNFVYPYLSSTSTARKYSVSALNSNNDKVELQSIDVEENSFAGTAHHAVMQYIDLQSRTKEEVEKEIDRLLAQGYIQKEQYDEINVDEIIACLNSEIMEKARQGIAYREQKFVLSKTADEVLQNGCKESVLIQGVIDLLIDGDELIVVDFKHSKLSSSKLKEKYRKQLLLYADAVSKTYDKYPDKLMLYVFGRNETIEIK